MLSAEEICIKMIDFLDELIQTDYEYRTECPIYIYDPSIKTKVKKRIDLAACGDGYSFALEIKRSKNDLCSGCGLNFVGDMNFLIVTESCYKEAKDIIEDIRKMYPYIYTEIIDDNTGKIIRELNCRIGNGFFHYSYYDQIVYGISIG